MPKVFDITKTQFFKIYEMLSENGDMTAAEIAKKGNFKMPSVRRVLSELSQADKLEIRHVYRLK